MDSFIVLSMGVILTGYSIFANKILRNTSHILMISLFILFFLSPLSSILIYEDFDYSNTLNLALIFFAVFIFVGFITMISFKKIKVDHSEERIKTNGSVLALISLFLVLCIIGTIKMYSIVFSYFEISNINDLNIAFSSDNLPSLGIYGRLNRLAIPLGLLSLILAINTKNNKFKFILFAYCAVFTLMLIGVRRSTIINQIALYIILYSININTFKSLLKSILPIVIALISITGFFGLVQIATNKSSYENPVYSGIFDGIKYFAGNMAYAECINVSNYGYPKGNSLPFIYQLLKINDEEKIYKPFCDIGSGEFFNTSPAYFDLERDGGIAGLVVFAAFLSCMVFLSYLNLINSLGVKAILTASIIFFPRENILGQYDAIYSILVYVGTTWILLRLSSEKVGAYYE